MAKSKKIHYWKIVNYLIYVAVVIFALLVISPKFSIGGFKLLVVKSGSMEPTIKTGSLVIDKTLTEYEIGDIITYKNPGKPSETTTHRIIAQEIQGDIEIFTTKGDANESPDTREITKRDIIGKVLFNVPYLGFSVDFAKKPFGFMLIIVVPAAIIIYDEVKKVWQEIIKMRQKRKQT